MSCVCHAGNVRVIKRRAHRRMHMFAKEPESDEVGLPTNWKKSQERSLKQKLDFSDISFY